jgi:hypothetical protein
MRGAKSNALFSNTAKHNPVCPCGALGIGLRILDSVEESLGRIQFCVSLVRAPADRPFSQPASGAFYRGTISVNTSSIRSTSSRITRIAW